MANFNTHLTGGFAVSGFFGLIVYKAELVTTPEFLLCVLVGTAGGLLPDIDSDNSTPIKIGFNVVAFCLAFAAVIHWRDSLSLLSILLLWLATYVLVRFGVFSVFKSFTVHRGMIHSVPYMVAMAIMLASANYYLFDTSSIVSWFYAAFLLLGALVHLSLDEMYSVDLLNQRIKRSSGTAMKFYKDSQRYYYLGLYLIIAVLVFTAPPFEPFWRRLTDPVTWWLIKTNLIPEVFTR